MLFYAADFQLPITAAPDLSPELEALLAELVGHASASRPGIQAVHNACSANRSQYGAVDYRTVVAQIANPMQQPMATSVLVPSSLQQPSASSSVRKAPSPSIGGQPNVTIELLNGRRIPFTAG